jgi:hypothetical protein
MPKVGRSPWVRDHRQHRDAGLTVGELLLILVVGAIAIGGAWFTMRQLQSTNQSAPAPGQSAPSTPQPSAPAGTNP